MAEQTAQDVVNQAQSVDEHSSVDGPGSSQKSFATKESGVVESERVEGAGSNVKEEATAHQSVSDTAEATSRTDSGASAKEEPSTASKQAETTQQLTNGVRDATPELNTYAKDTISNGDATSIQGSEDAGEPMSAGPDAATNSDFEGLSKSDELKPDRFSALKKPATFKSVSVTKNYLAKTGTGSIVAAKGLSDKSPGSIGSSASAAIRPRLVAKTGRDARLGNLGSASASGATVNTVWNRNQPVPPPPPKQFTDEELKQQYGIQLATRLGSDEPGKESKWADIDDDEAEWVPEPVDWVDGSKSGVAPMEEQPTTSSDPPISQIKQEVANSPATIPVVIEARPSSISSSGKTILRPGARLIPQTKPGLVLKSAPEQPSQQEQPSPHASLKSPWAKLPPVDKVSPVSFVPPAEPPSYQHSAAPRDAYPSDPTSFVSPAHEIGPDEFRRSWRDNERDGGSQLFNAQSGRYEPAKSVFRRPSRQEGALRAPALLQRGSQQEGSRSGSMPDERLSDRKGLSSMQVDDATITGTENVSETSKHLSDAAPLDRTLPQNHDSSNGPSAQDWQSAFAGVNATPFKSQADSNSLTDGKAQEDSSSHDSKTPSDPRQLQQQLMRERIEAARKRKQEEEAKEEAARRERIAAKLAALGPPPATSSVKTEEAKSAIASESAEPVEPGAATSRPPKNELPQPSAVKQEHLVEPEAATARPAKADDSRSTKTVPLSPVIDQQSNTSPPKAIQRLGESGLGLGSPARKRFGQSSLVKSLSGAATGETSPEEIQDLPGLGQLPPTTERSTGNSTWQGTTLPQPADASFAWASPRSKMHAGNVWGPPTSDRQIGNGAFDRALPHIQLPTQVPASQTSSNDVSARLPSLSPGISFDRPGNLAPAAQPIPQRTQEQQRGPYHQSPQQSHAPQSNQPRFPSYRHQMLANIALEPQQQAAKRAWQDFGKVVERHDAELRDNARREYAARMAQEDRQGDFTPTYHETFKKTVVGETLGQRHIVSVSKTIHDQHGSTEAPAVQAPIGTPYVQQQQNQVLVNLPVANTRGPTSRFFGFGTDRAQMAHMTSNADVIDSQYWSRSPPPPVGSDEHPIVTRRTREKPLVHLPAPAPVVKLPSRHGITTSRSDSPVQMPARPFRAGIQPIVNNADWQQRFNGLFARVDTLNAVSPSAVSPPIVLSVLADMTPALPVDTFSKAPYDILVVHNGVTGVTVALPRSAKVAASQRDHLREQSAETKPTEDEVWPDREFGSLPTVHLPEVSTWLNANAVMPLPHPIQSPSASKFQQLELSRDFTSTAQTTSPGAETHHTEKGVEIIVHLQGRDSKTMTMKNVKNRSVSGQKIRNKKPRNKKYDNASASPHDSPAVSGVENEKGPGKRAKRLPRDDTPAGPSTPDPEQKGHGGSENAKRARSTRGGRGGFKKTHGEHAASA